MATNSVSAHVANVAIAIACVLLSAHLVQRIVAPAPSNNRDAPDYRIGESIDLDPALFSGASATIVVVLRSTCRYCTESMPFYRSLAEHAGRGKSFRFLAAAREPQSALRDYLAGQQLHVDALLPLRHTELTRVRSTPTLLLIDSTGILKGSWRGMLQGRETEVLKELDRLVRPES
jgi:hypothetical protein